MAAMLIDVLSQNKSSVQTAIRVVEMLLLVAGVVSTFLMFKGVVAVAAPCSYDMVISTLSKAWFYLRSWLSSPFYIGIIMHLIVLLIFASSLLRYHKMDNNSSTDFVGVGDIDQDEDYQNTLSPSLSPLPSAPPPMHNSIQKPKKPAPAILARSGGTIRITPFKNHQYQQTCQDAEGQNCLSKSEPLETLLFSDVSCVTEAKEIKKTHSLDSSPQSVTAQKTMQPATIKKSLKKPNTKQKQLEEQIEDHLEIKNEEDDTLESTWRLITEAGAKPQNKQLRKSETCPQPRRVVAAQGNTETDTEEIKTSSAAASKELRKSMTFNDTVSIRCRGGLMRDPSMSLEEFNGRVEAFIKNVNNEMKLQRQESEQRYLDMIKRSL